MIRGIQISEWARVEWSAMGAPTARRGRRIHGDICFVPYRLGRMRALASEVRFCAKSEKSIPQRLKPFFVAFLRHG